MTHATPVSGERASDVSLVFDRVTKKYGRVTAVDNISFSIP